MLTVERPNIEIKSGQCFNIGLEDSGVNREYSMYSDATEKYIQFIIREVEDGIVSSQLRKLKPNQTIALAGPYGEFCIENSLGDRKKHFTFIATGTGIAPFRSFVKTFPSINYKLIHGIRSLEERYHFEEYGLHNYEACISRPTDDSKPRYVTDYLKKNPLNQETTVYVCGNRKMITDVFDLCRQQGINGSNIFTEVFF